MSDPRLIASKTELPIDDITLHDRLRPVTEAGVATIVASIGEIGQLANPVVVRQLHRPEGIVYRVLDGAHRLEAARRLDWPTVPVRVFECTDDQARIMEIDGNLSGAELNPLDTAVFLATRKAVYERLHPETRYATGKVLAFKRWDATDTMSAAFVATTAEKFGLSDRHVRRLVAAGASLHPDEIARLRAAPKPVTLKDLQVLGKSASVDRYFVVDLLSQGKAKSAADAIRQSKGAPPKRSDAQIKEDRLLDAWRSASTEVRRRFVAAHWAEMAGLMRDTPADDVEGGVE